MEYVLATPAASSSSPTQAMASSAQGEHIYVHSQHQLELTFDRMDLHEDREANKVTATFELPGLRKEDVHVDVHNGRLSISAETKVENEREQSGYAVRERRFGKFGRTLQLPQGVKEDEVKANLENGILTVTFPRSVPEVEPRKIKVD
jgi:HSP20 family protein